MKITNEWKIIIFRKFGKVMKLMKYENSAYESFLGFKFYLIINSEN